MAKPSYDAHTMATAGEASEELNRALWVALVAALTTFLRAARPRLGMKHGETCPRCKFQF